MTARILLLAENFPPINGGASRLFWEVSRRCPPGSMTVLTSWTAEDRDSAGRDPHVLRWSRSATEGAFGSTFHTWPFGQALRELREIARLHRIDRILAGRTLLEGWLALAVRVLDGIPYDCFTHGEEINTISNGESAGLLTSRRYRYMTRLVLRGAERIVANSDFTATVLREQWSIDARRIRLLRPGVDSRFFTPAPAGDSPPFPQWRGRHVVLTAGRLQARKGYDVLIRAIASLRGAVPDVLLAIAGAGEEEQRLRALVRELDIAAHVSFAGAVSEEVLRACYRHCDVFVLANRQIGCDVEGFGMVLLEAQACGVPVIAGRSGGSPETLIDGVTGLVVDCTAPEGLAAALTSLLGDPARRLAMGEAARRLVEERFDWESVMAGAGWLFDEAAAARR